MVMEILVNQGIRLNDILGNLILGLMIGAVIVGGFLILKQVYKLDIMELFRPSSQDLTIKKPGVHHIRITPGEPPQLRVVEASGDHITLRVDNTVIIIRKVEDEAPGHL